MRRTKKPDKHPFLSALLSLIGGSKMSGSLRKKIVADIDIQNRSHFKGIHNPNGVELGGMVKFRSGKFGWRIGELVAIVGYDDGRIFLSEKFFVTRKLHLLFPATRTTS